MMLDTPEQQLPYFHKSRDRLGLFRTSACLAFWEGSFPMRSGSPASKDSVGF